MFSYAIFIYAPHKYSIVYGHDKYSVKQQHKKSRRETKTK